VGRLPIIVALDPLDKPALVRILTEPKNAVVKQYQKLLAQDKVELVFTDDALEAAAERALKQKTGARGLRTIIEETLLDVMYEIPSQESVRKCVITADVIGGSRTPVLVSRNERSERSYEREAAPALAATAPAERVKDSDLEESA
jgi:ATP-dependent Clp protease ATP-binding subunit ClpX